MHSVSHEQREDDESPRWKVKREISIADILSFMSAALAVLYAYNTLDRRLTVMETAFIEYKAATRKQDEEMARIQARIDVRLDRMDEKLERLLQAQGRPR